LALQGTAITRFHGKRKPGQPNWLSPLRQLRKGQHTIQGYLPNFIRAAGVISVNLTLISWRAFTIVFLRQGLTKIQGKFLLFRKPPDFFNKRPYLKARTRTDSFLTEDNSPPLFAKALGNAHSLLKKTICC